jgi:hypothetical protein
VVNLRGANKMKINLDANQQQVILEKLNLKVVEMKSEELMNTDGGIMEGGCYLPYPDGPLPWPRKPLPIPSKPPVMTTMAIGEEDGGGIGATTLALGEESL